jgi:hypothetical protein
MGYMGSSVNALAEGLICAAAVSSSYRADRAPIDGYFLPGIRGSVTRLRQWRD